MTFDDNYRKPVPINRQRENELISTGTVHAIDSLVDKLGEIYIRGKELENKRLEIETLQLEIVQHYKTERTRLLQAFKARKDLRVGLERMLEKAIKEDDHEMKLTFLDLYREYITSLSSEASVKQFRGRNGSGPQDITIEI